MSTVTLNCNATGEFNYPDGGTWTASSGQVHEANGTAKFFDVPTPVSTADHKISINVISEQNPGYYHDSVVRMPNATDGGSNWDGYDLYTGENGDWGLVRGNAGVGSANLASGNLGALGASFLMELQATGTGATVTLNAWINSTQIVTNVTDTTGSRVTSGNYGAGAGFGSLHIDYVILTDIGGAPAARFISRRVRSRGNFINATRY